MARRWGWRAEWRVWRWARGAYTRQWRRGGWAEREADTHASRRGAVDNMAAGARDLAWLVIALVVGYAAARFGTILFDNLRNTVFEKVGQEATRRLTSNVFKHLHQLSLRFHLERRTGAVTKVVERGTKSIDTMLYFLLFNIAPTFLELGLVLTIFGTRFGAWLVIATLVMVAVYIVFTRIVTDWRAKPREQVNEADRRGGAEGAG